MLLFLYKAIETINVIISLIGRTKTSPKNPNILGKTSTNKIGKIKVLKAAIKADAKAF